MNRTIKFRAWHESDGVNGEMIHQRSSLVSEAILFWKSIYYDAKVMQFTGFKDTKGIEIFEGDTLSDVIDVYGMEFHTERKVFWNQPTGSWHLDKSILLDESISSELWKELQDFKYEIIK